MCGCALAEAEAAATVYAPGDVGLCRGTAILDRLIETGESIHGAGRGSRFSHAFVIVTPEGGTVEAQAKGVVRATVASHGPAVTILGAPAGLARPAVVDYAISRLGTAYNFLDDGLLGVDCLLGTTWHSHSKAVICSELAALAWQAGGWALPRPAAEIMPSTIYDLWIADQARGSA